jgi:Ca2+-binding EF-hand superfamily protein
MGAAQLSQVKKGCGCETTDVKKAEQIDNKGTKAFEASGGSDMTDAECLEAFKKALKEKFAKRSDAFDALGAAGDGRVDKDELTEFLRKDLGLGDVAPRVFALLDVDKSGYIDKDEFKSFGIGGDAPGKGKASKTSTSDKPSDVKKEFKKFLKSKFKKPEDAFKGLDDDDSRTVDLEEFTNFMSKTGFSGSAEAVFKMLDANHDGSLTFKEFKKQLSSPD